MTDSPPRILQVFNEYIEKGGEESSVNRIFSTLQGRGNITQCRFASEDWMGPRPMSAAQQALRMVYNPDSIRKIRQLDAEHRPDVWLLHNVFPVGSAGIFREAMRRGSPTVYYIHNFRPFSVNGYLWANDRVETAGLRRNFWPEIRAGAWQNSALKTFWYAMILQGLHTSGAYRRMHAWIAISDFMRDVFIEAGVEPDKIHTIRHSWDPLPSPPAAQDDGHYLFLGRLAPMKGVFTLFETWEILEQELGNACPQLVIGGDGPLKKEVLSLAARSKRVKYAGRVAGMTKSELITGCRAMLAPSVWWEPLGLVTYEAYDYAKPMLAARSGGLTETVLHGETGFLHEPGNARELANHILHLEQHPECRPAMGCRGRSWLLENTSESNWIDQFLTVIQSVLS